jgi:hypothetical protein
MASLIPLSTISIISQNQYTTSALASPSSSFYTTNNHISTQMRKQLSSSLYIPPVKVSPNPCSSTNNIDKPCQLPPKKIEFARNSIKRIVHHTNTNTAVNSNTNSNNYHVADNKPHSTTQITVKPVYLNSNNNNIEQNLNLEQTSNRRAEKNPNLNFKQQQQNTNFSGKPQQHSDVSIILRFPNKYYKLIYEFEQKKRRKRISGTHG